MEAPLVRGADDHPRAHDVDVGAALVAQIPIHRGLERRPGDARELEGPAPGSSRVSDEWPLPCVRRGGGRPGAVGEARDVGLEGTEAVSGAVGAAARGAVRRGLHDPEALADVAPREAPRGHVRGARAAVVASPAVGVVVAGAARRAVVVVVVVVARGVVLVLVMLLAAVVVVARSVVLVLVVLLRAAVVIRRSLRLALALEGAAGAAADHRRSDPGLRAEQEQQQHGAHGSEQNSARERAAGLRFPSYSRSLLVSSSQFY